eukprot:TRINITY_DN1186_c0_g5_i1.p1 TRINITY_DN1186_c0_g5~~TRINITY_DN1186_c0_g5_i1.p1  ORF type:complete len:612 (-),score=97.94 TRINITY_DN1186_c0_g5_i1:416-2251(-)
MVLANPITVVLAVVLVFAVFYYLFGGGFGRKKRYDYSVLVGEQPENGTKIIRNALTPDKLVSDYKNCKTIYDAFRASVMVHGKNKCLGSRSQIREHTEEKIIRDQKRTWVYPELGPYQWTTYEEVELRSRHIGAALVKTGVAPKQNLAVYIETRAEWTLSAQAAFSQSIVVMTVYANLGEEALVYGLNQSKCSHIITSGELLGSLARYVSQLSHIRYIIYCDAVKAKPADLETLKRAGKDLITFEAFEKLGSSVVDKFPPNPPKSDDLAVLMYTSGSTGMPKGVQCTHGNCMASVGGVLKVFSLYPQDVHLSYLPLAHILAFMVEVACLANGCALAYGNARTLTDASVRNCKGDISESIPSFLVGVPTVYDKIKSGITAKIEKSPLLVRKLFQLGFDSKKAAVSVGKTTPLFDLLVFNKIKLALGGNVRFIISGGAPLSKECGEFLKICFGVPVIQGYALTETTAGGTIGMLDDLESHTNVGPPIGSTEIKLVDCPEMGYTHHDPEPRGEIWIRGPGVSKGYYENPEKTAEDFTPDRWFKTGDVGRLNRNGTLSIIDRKKNLIKPPHGEYVACGISTATTPPLSPLLKTPPPGSQQYHHLFPYFLTSCVQC